MKNTITSKQACIIAHQIRRETGCSLAEAFKAAYAGNSTINPKTSWTADELNQIFSDKAAELLRKGYTIDLAGMSGHQGEIGKVVFKKNSNYYLLIMERKSNLFRGKYNEHYTIRFGKYTEKIENHGLNTWVTLWIDRFDTTWSLEFVKVTDNYFVTEELADEFNKKSKARRDARYCGVIPPVDTKYYKVLLKMVRKQKGHKSVKLSDIKSAYRVNSMKHNYTVVLNTQDKNGRAVVVNVNF